MARLSLFLLGPFQASLDGEPITAFESDKVRALLAYLAIESHRPHRRETLAGLLWSERPERRARQNLSQALSNLRRTIGDRDAEPPLLLVTPQTLQLNPASDHWLDATVLAGLLDASDKHRHRRIEACHSCMDRLQQAVALYRGGFLEGFSLGDSAGFEEWSLLQRERFHRLVVEALHRLANCHAQRGEVEQALHHARRQLELDPWREQAHRQLMRLLALSGQRGAALAQYETCRRILAEELAVEPEEETRALYERIRDGAELDVLPTPPPHNLPTSLIPFVGRETELAQIGDQLHDPNCRLLTLVGPGGSGKTRLALEAAAAQIHNFAHGVHFVSLAPLRSAESIVPTVAQALGFSFYEGGEPGQQLLDYLRQKSLLLILDSFEHLLACPERRPELAEGPGRSDGAGWVIDVLRTAPDVTILTTSRARLNVRGERLFPVAGLDYPALGAEAIPTPSVPLGASPGETKDVAQYSAVQLFLQSARRARPGFEAAADDLADVAHICCLVQGMPLGILLAAAWMGMLTPAEIAAEIGHSLDFLETDWRGVPQRQQSMRAVFDHSWSLVPEREREMFQALSVFRGGFTQGAAEQVAGASLRELMALVNRSLLQRTPTGRYEVHELLRQYTAEKLDQSPVASEAAHDRHSAYYAAALQQWAADLKGPRQQAALAEVEADSENARAAWNWAVERGQVARLDQALEGLCRFYSWRGRYQEGEAVCRAAAGKLAATAAGSSDGLRVWAKVLTWQGLFSQGLGRAELARQLLQKGVALLDEPALADQDTRPEKASVLLEMGHGVVDSDRTEARQLYEQSLALYRALGDRWGTANALAGLAEVAANLGAFAETKQLYEEILAIRRALGDQRGIASSLMYLSGVAVFMGAFEQAERLMRKSVAIRQEIGDRGGIASGWHTLGGNLCWLGKFTEGQALLEQSVAAYKDLGVHRGLALSTVQLGMSNMFLGQYKQARAQAQQALALAQESGDRHLSGMSLLLMGWVALAEQAYAEARELLQESLATYCEIGQWEELGMALSLLGVATRGLGQLPQARRHFSEVLRMLTEARPFVPIVLALTLPTMALPLADQGEVEWAVELYALASRHPVVANSRWFEDVVGRHIAAVAATLPPDVVAAAQARGRERDVHATVAELLVELGDGQGE